MRHGTYIESIAFPWGSNYFYMVPFWRTGNLTTFIHGMKIGHMKNGHVKRLRISACEILKGS